MKAIDLRLACKALGIETGAELARRLGYERRHWGRGRQILEGSRKVTPEVAAAIERMLCEKSHRQGGSGARTEAL